MRTRFLICLPLVLSWWAVKKTAPDHPGRAVGAIREQRQFSALSSAEETRWRRDSYAKIWPQRVAKIVETLTPAMIQRLRQNADGT